MSLCELKKGKEELINEYQNESNPESNPQPLTYQTELLLMMNY